MTTKRKSSGVTTSPHSVSPKADFGIRYMSHTGELHLLAVDKKVMLERSNTFFKALESNKNITYDMITGLRYYNVNQDDGYWVEYGAILDYLHYIHFPQSRPHSLHNSWADILTAAVLFDDNEFKNEFKVFARDKLQRISEMEWEIINKYPDYKRIFANSCSSGKLVDMYESEDVDTYDFLAMVNKKHTYEMDELMYMIHDLEDRLVKVDKKYMSGSSDCTACLPPFFYYMAHTCVPCGYKYLHEKNKCRCQFETDDISRDEGAANNTSPADSNFKPCAFHDSNKCTCHTLPIRDTWYCRSNCACRENINGGGDVDIQKWLDSAAATT
jgi:hypothetical protein